jgi:Guanosine polyphosphate pyrophosphohydrolases/synthetases
MDHIAEFGVAAHWKYKDPKKIKEDDSKEYKWMHELLDLMNQSNTQDELIENFKIKLFQDSIYVFSPKGDVIELPKNSTPIDFAYSIHSEIGDKCVAAKINSNLQPLKSLLKNGDQVEILTSDDSQPSPLWERFAATSKVKSQIRRFIRSKKRNEHIKFGKEILVNAFMNEEIEFSYSAINKILKKNRILKNLMIYLN